MSSLFDMASQLQQSQLAVAATEEKFQKQKRDIEDLTSKCHAVELIQAETERNLIRTKRTAQKKAKPSGKARIDVVKGVTGHFQTFSDLLL